MTDLEFRDPFFLLLIILTPLVFQLARRQPSVVRYSSLALLEAAPTSWRVKLLPLPAVFWALASALLALALAGPRIGDATTRIQREGIAMMLVVARSGSMNARDFVDEDRSIDRLDAVKSVLSTFLGQDGRGPGRPDDLVGLITFARYADSVAPLTLDHANLKSILDAVEVVNDPDEDGTAVGEGLALAVERLRRYPAKSRIVVLLTDGVSNTGDVSPAQAAELAAQYGMKVYAVGAGRTGQAPFPVEWGGQTVLRQAFVELDERSLQALADKTDGRYFHAEDAETLEEVYAEIDSLERSEILEVRYMQYQELYGYFAGGAATMMAIAALLGQSLLRRLP
ncbi:VWA domain-containing protein [Myxococcota bacterium]|nr:VWA domain-containing protein [Myxococcota bacterium]